jgi:predicted ester cyclase
MPTVDPAVRHGGCYSSPRGHLLRRESVEFIKETRMHTTQRNRAIFQQMQEATTTRGITAQADFFAERAFNHGMPVTRDDVRAVLQDIADTFGDVRLDPLDVVADGDWVVVRSTFSGTHTGVGRHPYVHHGLLAGVAPTGRRMEVQHIHMFRFENGEIVEHWATRDDVEMMLQLGLPIRAA